MKEELRKISTEAQAEIAAASSEAELEAARVKYSGKKGRLTAILRGMGALDPDARREVGELANTVRGELEAAIAAARRWRSGWRRRSLTSRCRAARSPADGCTRCTRWRTASAKFSSAWALRS